MTKRRIKYYAIFALIHSVYALLLNNITAFAPDELGYLNFYEHLYNKNYVSYFFGWPEANIYLLRIIYLPSKLIDIIGADSISSIRLTAVLLHFILFKHCVIKTETLNNPFKNIIPILFLIPSLTLWLSLGLRESYLFFFSYFIFEYMQQFCKKQNSKSVIFIVLLFTGLYLTKTYIYLVLFLSLFLSAVTNYLKNKQTRSPFKILFISFLILFISPNNTMNALHIFELKQNNSLSHKIKVQQAQPSESLTENLLNPQLEANHLLGWVLEKSELKDKLAYNSKLDTSRKIQVLDTSIEKTNNLDEINVFNSTIRFLIEPNVFQNYDSEFITLLSYESIFWFFLFLLVMAYQIKYRKHLLLENYVKYSLVYFLLIFIVSSSIFETNLGTAYRHKALLIPLLLYLFVNMGVKSSARD